MRLDQVEGYVDTVLALKKEYEKFGYNTVDVPFLTPQKRAEWVLERL